MLNGCLCQHTKTLLNSWLRVGVGKALMSKVGFYYSRLAFLHSVLVSITIAMHAFLSVVGGNISNKCAEQETLGCGAPVQWSHQLVTQYKG
jgi:hypothetical protein